MSLNNERLRELHNVVLLAKWLTEPCEIPIPNEEKQKLVDLERLVAAHILPETLEECEREIGVAYEGSTYRWQCYGYDGAEFEFRHGDAGDALRAVRECVQYKRLATLRGEGYERGYY